MRAFQLDQRCTSRRIGNAGFTLVELMTVVLITGVLAMAGIALVRGHVQVAKAIRAQAGVQAIRTAEEGFRAQNGQYLDCSGKNAKWYPMLSPGKTKYDWHQSSHPDYANWSGLGVQGINTTQYGYLVNAGNPNAAFPTLQTAAKPTFAASPDHWYIIQVKGDLDGDGVPMLGLASSFNREVYLEHEGE
jgi:prepilin-type N-terminal cleavage/methylation domain-containing protein